MPALMKATAGKGGRRCYVVGGERFDTQAALRKRVRSILHCVSAGEYLGEPDFRFMLDLLGYHPWATEKIGVGAFAIKVDVKGDPYPTPHFVLVRTDGTETDFSYGTCLRPPGELDDFKAACREEVRQQVIAFRDAARAAAPAGHVVCAVTGDTVPEDDSHVDHEPPRTFERLLLDFVDLKGLDPVKVEVVGFEDGAMAKRLVDRRLAEAWQLFHNENARLRMVSSRANLSIVKRKSRQVRGAVA